MSEETVKRLGLATYDDLRYLLELINDIISLTDEEDERETLLRCYAWIQNQSTGRMFRALMEGVDYTTMEGGE
jgi:hypothetical protein